MNTPPQPDLLGILLEAQVKFGGDREMKRLGREMFRMYTERGFPPDMFLDELSKRCELDLLAKVFIVSEYQAAFLEHRRMSGIYDKRLADLREKNLEDIRRLVRTGELGIY